jgi:hypothetical protein
MDEDIKAIYDFVCKQEDLNHKVSDAMQLDALKSHYSDMATVFWTVKSFIEVNFKGDSDG